MISSDPPRFAYPLMLDVSCRPCLVVGGGAVAERKVEGLVEAGARVTVVSPALTDRLLRLATEPSSGGARASTWRETPPASSSSWSPPTTRP